MYLSYNTTEDAYLTLHMFTIDECVSEENALSVES